MNHDVKPLPNGDFEVIYPQDQKALQAYSESPIRPQIKPLTALEEAQLLAEDHR